jgi:hypothetical protein
MLAFNDDRWANLKGGRRTRCDPRQLLVKLETASAAEGIWSELWDELHHQGDVDEASYASVPHLVRIYRKRGVVDWNTYAMVAIIELARGQGGNPDVPNWMKESYFQALNELGETALKELPVAQNQEEVRAILSILAIQKGARTHGRILLEYSEAELLDLESAASEA